MREIKFRAWDCEQKKFYGDAESKEMLMRQSLFDRGQANGVNYRGIIKFCQYTGFLDNNGKEIYESDIIEWYQGELIIRARVDWCFYGWFPFSGLSEITTPSPEDSCIIGNTCEDPNLVVINLIDYSKKKRGINEIEST